MNSEKKSETNQTLNFFLTALAKIHQTTKSYGHKLGPMTARKRSSTEKKKMKLVFSVWWPGSNVGVKPLLPVLIGIFM